MTRKINWILLAILFVILIYTRFVNLGWGLPYPFHPDERNMALALQQLQCRSFQFPVSSFQFLRECFNPHFFAYGQLPIYLGYLLHFGRSVTFESAVLVLRFISAIASILTVWFFLKTLEIFNVKNKILNILLFTFSPALIQFAHFGTTESLLMLLYSLIIYLSLKRKFVLGGIIVGAAIATKISSLIFILVPLYTILTSQHEPTRFMLRLAKLVFLLLILSLIFALMLSPHNLISFSDFISSIHYESDVALGRVIPFYTRQFVGTIPVLFQFTKVFPNALGWPILILFTLGFFFLSYDKKINFLRFAFLIYFIPTALIFAKWTRFMVPVIPLMIIFAILFLQRIKPSALTIFIIVTAIIPGLTYLSVYQKPDVRFTASEWIYKNVPANSYILSETANVVDIPLNQVGYKVISFDFYNLDENPVLQGELAEHISKVDYVFIPSRRIFANHPKDKYPILNKYYADLFSGKLGFKKVAEFSAGLNDESAEETWTVFDHPVIRIYKK